MPSIQSRLQVRTSATETPWADVGHGSADQKLPVLASGNTVKDGSGTDEVLLTVDGKLQIDIISGGGGGTQYTEGDTDATITGTALMWEDTANTLRAISSAKPLPVDGSAVTQPVSGTFWQATQPVSGTVTANAGTNLNTSSLLTGTVFTGRLGEVQATPTANTVLARLKTIADNQLADSHNVTVDNASLPVTGTFWQATQPVSIAGTVAVDLGANNDVTVTSTDSDGLEVQGGLDHDAVDAGSPLKIGFKAKSPDGTDPGNVAENDRSDGYSDLNGRQFVNTWHPRSAHKHLDGSTAYTDEALVADPGDGFQVIIKSIIVSTGAATAMNFFLEEATTKIFGPIYLEAVAGRGFVSGPIHLPVTAATAVTLTTSASIAQSIDVDYEIQAV